MCNQVELEAQNPEYGFATPMALEPMITFIRPEIVTFVF